jgi:hypothetical protein
MIADYNKAPRIIKFIDMHPRIFHGFTIKSADLRCGVQFQKSSVGLIEMRYIPIGTSDYHPL